MDRSEIDKSADELFKLWTDEKKLLTLAEQADVEVLSALIARFGSTGSSGARHDALRGGCNAILQRRLNDQLIRTMVHLDRSATFLSWVGIVLAVVIGVAQIVLPFACAHQGASAQPSAQADAATGGPRGLP